MNRFASRLGPHTVAVVLEPDVAEVFDSSRAVNKLLRSVIAANSTSGSAPCLSPKNGLTPAWSQRRSTASGSSRAPSAAAQAEYVSWLISVDDRFTLWRFHG